MLGQPLADNCVNVHHYYTGVSSPAFPEGAAGFLRHINAGKSQICCNTAAGFAPSFLHCNDAPGATRRLGQNYRICYTNPV